MSEDRRRPNRDRRSQERAGGPRPKPRGDMAPAGDLPREINREIEQIAHFGKARLVKEAMTEASAAYEDGRFAEALPPLLRSKGFAPRSGSVRELLGLVYYRLGRWREAARELAAYRRLSNRRDQDHVYADCERALDKPERAVEILEGLGAQDVSEETFIEGLIVGAGALGDLGRWDEAVERLRSGPTSPPEVLEHHLRLWYALADALERAGRRPEARDWWDAIYAEDPEFFDVDNRRLGVRSSG